MAFCLLRKSQIANASGYVLRTIIDENGNSSHRWFRAGSERADAATSHHTDNPEIRMSDAMRTIPMPEFEPTSDTNRGSNRRVRQLRVMAVTGDIDGIANFSTSRTRANYARVDDYRQALLAAANRVRTTAPQSPALGAAPAAPTVTGSNMQNGALISAQIKINRLHAATQADDPVSAVLAVTTSRTNPYTTAADNYRTELLRHFGYNADGTQMSGHAPSAPEPVAPVVAPEIATPRPPRAPRTPRPTNPVLGSANPSNLAEEQLGFVPRPDMPIDYHLGRDGYHDNRNRTGTLHPYPSKQMRDLARRYLAQDPELQTRARNYQVGTWTPPDPAAAARAEAQRRQEMEQMRQVAANFNAKVSQQTDWKPKGQVGANITEYSVDPTKIPAIASVFGVPVGTVKQIAATMVADYGGNITFKATISASGNEATIRFKGSDGTSINRTFTRSNGKLSVYHAYFKAYTTGTGSGKALFRTSMGAYKVLGITDVTVSANIDVGGYAWARFGYRTRDNYSWEEIQGELNIRLSALENGTHSVRVSPEGSTGGTKETKSFPKLSKAACDRARAVLASDDPYAIWKISDMKIGGREVGKELLLGTSWRGIIELNDTKAMRRLKQYVNQ